MSRRAARITQAEIARALRAAQQAGNDYEVGFGRSGALTIAPRKATPRLDPIPAYFEEKFSIYFIQRGDFIKIGRSKKPAHRLLTMRTGNPFDLKIVHTIKGRDWLEGELHERFKSLHHRDEWFRLEGELKAWLEAETGKTL